MVDALADVQECLARIVASGKCGPAFSLLDRLKGFIDRGVAKQQGTFSRVRGYTAQVREVATLIPTLDAHSQQPGVFTEDELVGFATATASASQFASPQRHGVIKKAR